MLFQDDPASGIIVDGRTLKIMVVTPQAITVDLHVDPELNGQPIRVTEAAEKYNVNQATLSRWAASGIVRIIEQRQKLLILDESSVALVTRIYHTAMALTSPRQAGWILKRAIENC